MCWLFNFSFSFIILIFTHCYPTLLNIFRYLCSGFCSKFMLFDVIKYFQIKSFWLKRIVFFLCIKWFIFLAKNVIIHSLAKFKESLNRWMEEERDCQRARSLDVLPLGARFAFHVWRYQRGAIHCKIWHIIINCDKSIKFI